MRRRYSRDLRGVDVAVSGVPFDTATSNPPTFTAPKSIITAPMTFTGTDLDLERLSAAAGAYGGAAQDRPAARAARALALTGVRADVVVTSGNGTVLVGRDSVRAGPCRGGSA